MIKPNPSEDGDGKLRVYEIETAELPKDDPEVSPAFSLLDVF